VKPRNREINIFNLSMLDVISGAMAAFLILVVVLLPYYKKEHIDYQAMNNELRQALAEAEARAQAAEADAETARAAAEAAAEQARQARADAEVAQERLREVQEASENTAERVRVAEAEAQRERERAEGLARTLAKTFIVLFVRWDTHDDIDLHVVDPSGAEFYWDGHRTIPGRLGELSEDTRIGPGAEVWEIRAAPAGEYKVFVELFAVNDRRKPVTVKGRVFHRDGSSALREAQLRTERQKESLALIRVDDQGKVTVR
jgi:F0F1-type ATP synthase membrane subunit b/b'